MDLARREIQAPKHRIIGHPVIAVRMLRRDRPLVSKKKCHQLPVHALAHARRDEQSVHAFRRAAARQRDMKCPLVPMHVRRQCDKHLRSLPADLCGVMKNLYGG